MDYFTFHQETTMPKYIPNDPEDRFKSGGHWDLPNTPTVHIQNDGQSIGQKGEIYPIKIVHDIEDPKKSRNT